MNEVIEVPAHEATAFEKVDGQELAVEEFVEESAIDLETQESM